MEKNNKPTYHKESKKPISMIEQTISDLTIEDSLAESMMRFKDTLFRRDFSDDFTKYFQRVEAFNGYIAGDRNAQGFAFDMIGQICGTVGQLKSAMRKADIEGRDLTADEIARASRNFQKAAAIREASAASFVADNDEDMNEKQIHLSATHVIEQMQLQCLAENVPDVIEVMREVEKRRQAGESLF